MLNPLKRFLTIAVLSFLTYLSAAAQNDPVTQPVDMADTFRSNGKIYVVVATMLIILAGIVLYLFRTESRLKRLEKKD